MQVDASDIASTAYGVGVIGAIIAGIIATGRANSGIPLRAVKPHGTSQQMKVTATCRLHGPMTIAELSSKTTIWKCATPDCSSKATANFR
jgi:hypothetical protein